MQHDAARDEGQDDQGVRDVADVDGGDVEEGWVAKGWVIDADASRGVDVDSASGKISASQEIYNASIKIGKGKVGFLLEGRREVGHG